MTSQQLFILLVQTNALAATIRMGATNCLDATNLNKVGVAVELASTVSCAVINAWSIGTYNFDAPQFSTVDGQITVPPPVPPYQPKMTVNAMALQLVAWVFTGVNKPEWL